MKTWIACLLLISISVGRSQIPADAGSVTNEPTAKVPPAVQTNSDAPSAPASTDDGNLEYVRFKEIAAFKKMANDPNATPKQKDDAIKFAFAIFDLDEGIISEKNKQIESLSNAANAAPSPAPAAEPPPTTPAVDSPSPSAGQAPLTTISAEPIHEGLNIVGVDAKVVEPGETYDYVGWKVVLYNNSDTPITDISVRIIFLDKDHFELDHDSDQVFKVAPHESFTVTGRDMMKPDTWSKVDNYSVKTE